LAEMKLSSEIILITQLGCRHCLTTVAFIQDFWLWL